METRDHVSFHSQLKCQFHMASLSGESAPGATKEGNLR